MKTDYFFSVKINSLQKYFAVCEKNSNFAKANFNKIKYQQMKKVSEYIKLNNGGYDWKFSSVGGVTRVNIESGEDIAHLGELDQKLWTVLSCPVKGLEFDEHTLQFMDFDGDGKIRVNEVVETSQWLCKVLRNPDELLKGACCIDFSELNSETEEGKQVISLAKDVLKRLGKDSESISIADISQYKDIFEETCRSSHEAIADDYELPYGEKSDDAVAAVNALRDKVNDYFMRCKLIRFNEECSASLDVSSEKIAEISTKNLSLCSSEIATFPLLHPRKDSLLPVNEGINPAWQAQFSNLKATVLDVDFAGSDFITEADWQSVLAKIDAYTVWKTEKDGKDAENLSNELAAYASAIAPVERFLYLNRDFFKLLRNYVVFFDFYSRNKDDQAIFQAGTLYIDQRCCELCVKVPDMAKHADMAGLSGMYLIYCNCTSKVKGEKMDIVAVLTDGDVDSLCVGKNAVFYDRNGLDWDAVVTKIIDNPISIRQAFWSPYKKFWNWCTEKLNKSAAEKESKSFENLTSKADATLTDIKEETPEGAEKKKTEPKAAFDIAKFAGIFAAIGMAIGYLTSALAGITTSISDKPFNAVIFIVVIMLVISGPSMLIAWLKLRKRNLGPILNANGWAINAKVLVNVRFGATLTSLASYPKMVFDDPFAEKKTPKWKKWLIGILSALVVLFGILFFTNSLKCIGLPFGKQDKAAVEKVEDTAKCDAPAAAEPAPETQAEAPATE